jgi:hypothetical protein
MKVKCSYTLEFDADQYREAFGIEGERMSVADIRNEVQWRSSDFAMTLSDEGVEVKVTHHHLT